MTTETPVNILKLIAWYNVFSIQKCIMTSSVFWYQSAFNLLLFNHLLISFSEIKIKDSDIDCGF